VHEQRLKPLFLLYPSAFLSVLTLSIFSPAQDSHFRSEQAIHWVQ